MVKMLVVYRKVNGKKQIMSNSKLSILRHGFNFKIGAYHLIEIKGVSYGINDVIDTIDTELSPVDDSEDKARISYRVVQHVSVTENSTILDVVIVDFELID